MEKFHRARACVLAEGALLLGEDPGGDVVLAGDGVELDAVDGGGLERPHGPSAALRGHGLERR